MIFMRYRMLGSTGIKISEIAFGAGPVAVLMTGPDADLQRRVVSHAIRCGINWFDTAATYGDGRSETHLGQALSQCDSLHSVHVATKVRVHLRGETDLRPMVIKSVQESLQRLRLPRVSLVQVHNSITRNRDDEPTSITPDDVLGPRGVVEAFEQLRAEGLVEHFGLTGIGDPASLRAVIGSRRFATIQAPYHLLNPTAFHACELKTAQPNYGGFLRDAAALGMGIMAIRVFAAGALLDQMPSAHTHKTAFLPLALYERDRRAAVQLQTALGEYPAMAHWALRFALTPAAVSTAIIGFADPGQIDQAVSANEQGPLTETELDQLSTAMQRLVP